MLLSPVAYLQHQRALLQTEYAHEKEEFQRLTEATGVDRKVRRGMAWFPLEIGRSYHNSLDQLVVEVHKRDASSASTDVEEPTLFEPGKPVDRKSVV